LTQRATTNAIDSDIEIRINVLHSSQPRYPFHLPAAIGQNKGCLEEAKLLVVAWIHNLTMTMPSVVVEALLPQPMVLVQNIFVPLTMGVPPGG
jgi:hypothetical protein